MKRCLLILMILLQAGCSQQYWTAKFAMYQAESALDKAAHMKNQKIPYEKRQDLYKDACKYFLTAYQANPAIFSLNRIEIAVDACWRAGDNDAELVFQIFQEKYTKEHPREAEFGDPGDLVGDM